MRATGYIDVVRLNGGSMQRTDLDTLTQYIIYNVKLCPLIKKKKKACSL